jgi:hypothetical protein
MLAESIDVSTLLLFVDDLVIPWPGSTKVLSLERRAGLCGLSFPSVLVGTLSRKWSIDERVRVRVSDGGVVDIDSPSAFFFGSLAALVGDLGM